MKKVLYPLATAALFSAATTAHAESESLVIGTNNWAENIAVANMWKLILEDGHGYDVELSDVGKNALYSGLANGDFDISLEIWLPTTDAPYLEPYKDQVEINDGWYEGTGLGVVVPTYVDIDTLDELGEHADDFEYQGNPTILGIDSGSSIAGLTEQAIDEYSLPLEQVNSSGPAMMAALDDAYSREEPIAVTLWSPHWAFAEYDLKYLEDPKNVYGDNENIYWFSRQNFTDEDPWLTQVLNEWHMDDDSLGGLMADIEKAGDPVEGAQTWIDDNQDLIDEWLAAGE